MVDEALDFYVKTRGRDGAQKRQELMNKRPGELKRSLEHWETRAKEVQRLQDKEEQAWDLCSRVPSFGRKKKEDFERDFAHKVVYSGKVDEKRLREWTDEMQSKVQSRRASSLKLERESGWSRRTPIPKVVEHGRSYGKQEPSPHHHTFLRFSDDSTTFAVASSNEASDMNQLATVQTANTAVAPHACISRHSRHGETCSVCHPPVHLPD